MLLRQLFDAGSSSYTYLVADTAAGKALLVDPVIEQVERDVQLLADLGLELVYTIETHIHADHITGAGKLKERLGSTQVVPKRGGTTCADLVVSGGDVLRVGAIELRVIETPGHTAGCTSWICGANVFTGDTLLVRTCGRTDFQDGDPGALYDSITQKLFALPDDTVVWPAHDYKGHSASTIGEEKRWNARVAGRSRNQFIDLMNGLTLPMPKKIGEAVPANMACGCPPEATT